ncbi:hypothetical protein T4A_2749 [Trichinella pseudospiralis]|uniref:Uncharacterized protein n=1 Tax=Trichinella pseudospiralis TaxID=6337 RepID=A0A0V1ECZ7_TRIPS|nr:hypothetical protein T4A_2749 [Trichinella pseudospiralis]
MLIIISKNNNKLQRITVENTVRKKIKHNKKKVCKGQDRGRYLAQIDSHFDPAGTSRSSLMGSAHQKGVC